MSTITQGSKFPTTLITQMFNAVKGKSSIAKMIAAEPIAFNGNTQFTFSLDNEIAIVGESGQKPAGDGTVAPVVIRPIKVVYQSRVSDEFIYAAEEAQLKYLEEFADGFAKKLATGIDLMIMHGIDPYSGEAASATIANNYLDYVIEHYESGANVVEYGHDSTAADENIDEALALVDDATGIIMGKTIRSAVAALKTNGVRQYPEFAWGATPETLGGMTVDSNKTVEYNSDPARAYVGDFNALKWGYAKEMPLEVIQYGDPDGQGDLKRTNEVILRSEAFVGWGILDAASFAMVKAEEVSA